MEGDPLKIHGYKHKEINYKTCHVYFTCLNIKIHLWLTCVEYSVYTSINVDMYVIFISLCIFRAKRPYTNTNRWTGNLKMPLLHYLQILNPVLYCF